MIDVARIKVKAGNGGDGAVSFRREKYVPRGGPDGGDGGDGGNVYIRADSNMATLMDFRSKPYYKAPNGAPGRGKTMKGSSGEDVYINVPLGTLVYGFVGEDEKLLGDMTEPGQTLLIARGGKGGVGNYRFKSSTNRTPRQYVPGKTTEGVELRLEIKLMADVGLIGLPNAGKSTLINAMTSANAKVGHFPFTTLSPNLGVMPLKDGSKVVLADIPGLIEGASKGKGLGDQFLRHIERTRILVHVIDPLEGGGDDLAANAVRNYDTIRKELGDYNKALVEKFEIIVINKLDVTEIATAFDEVAAVFKKRDLEILGISAATGQGLEALSDSLVQKLGAIPKKPLVVPETPVRVVRMEDLPNKRMVFDQDSVRER